MAIIGNGFHGCYIDRSIGAWCRCWNGYPFMNAIAEGLGDLGWRVKRFEFPYMEKSRERGKKSPPNSLPKYKQRFSPKYMPVQVPLSLENQWVVVSQRPFREFIGYWLCCAGISLSSTWKTRLPQNWSICSPFKKR